MKLFVPLVLTLAFYIGNYSLGVAQSGYSHGVGNCTSMLQGVEALRSNPSGLPLLRRKVIVFTNEQKYFLKELAGNSIGIGLPTKSGVFGVVILNSSNHLIRRNFLRFGFGKKITDNLNIGVRLSYLRLSYHDLIRNKNFVSADIGFQYSLTTNLLISAEAKNISFIIRDKERLPVGDMNSLLSFGLSHFLSSKVMLMAEIEKKTFENLRFKVGLDYKLVKGFSLRVGFYSNHFTNTFGIGYSINRFRIDVGGERHPILGYSLTSSIGYRLGNNDGEK